MSKLARVVVLLMLPTTEAKAHTDKLLLRVALPAYSHL